MITDDREPWEIAQDREAAYWDGRHPWHAAAPPTSDTIERLVAEHPDPYGIGESYRKEK